ncbi:hypothetical protein [Streptomyces sp. NPDC046727]|uniref:hypothetical protein n=1 Tax=Streptomyces sp. NPDC046727 TaxID=3155373 RepID=UPI0033CFFE20
MGTAARTPVVFGPRRALRRPVAGMAPGIVFSLLAGPGRFEIAVALALARSIALIVLGSMAVGRPFTLPYAREQVDRAHWDTPAFLRTNHVITGVWGLAFLVAAVAGGFGGLVLHDPPSGVPRSSAPAPGARAACRVCWSTWPACSSRRASSS